MGEGHTNAIDREVKYQLDEVFNPWSLVDAVDKDTKSWVEIFNADGTWSTKTLTYVPVLTNNLDNGMIIVALPKEFWSMVCY
jgi:hypothetical protein